MPVDLLFITAAVTFALGLSLATYRWFALHNGWPMGEWQAHRPGLPIAIGLFAVLFAMLFAMARGGASVVVVPLFGVLCAWAWTAVLRIGAQSALLLAPLSVIALLVLWLAAIGPADGPATPARFERPVERDISGAGPRRLAEPVEEAGRGIPTDRQPDAVPSPQQ